MDLADDGEAPLHGASSRMPRKVVVSLLATGHSVERLAAAPAPNGSSDREEAELAEEATESGKDAVLRMVGTSHDTVDSTEDCVPQGPSCRNAIHEAKNVSKLPKKLGNSHKKRRTLKGKTAGTAVASAVSSKRTLNRDLPDQLEVHAHRLLRDSGWIITPRRRHDRPKMAYYFVAPQREVVVISLSQAWKFCGQRLHKATGGSEWGKFPMEWSDADPFWKDLVDTMAYVGKMTENGESSLTLLRRWQLLDPFVAVIFIDKMITALQKQKTLRAVDSSTFVLDDDEHSPSENKSTLVTLSSGYKQVPTDNCNGHQDMQKLSSSHGSPVKPDLCCTLAMSPEVVGHSENNIFGSNNEPEKIFSSANHNDNLVKRVRKKSKWMSDFESAGLNGLFAQSFMQTTIGSNEPGLCSSGSTSKKHAKAKSKPAKLIGEKRDLSLPPKCKRVTESGADKFVPVKKQQSRSLKKPSLRVSSKEVDAISNDSNEDVKSSRKRDATMLECTMPLEAKGTKKFGIKRKSENWEKHAKERPSEMHYNDDDLLITAIVKNKDISSFQKSAPRLVSSSAMFRRLKSAKICSRLLIQTAGKGGTNLLDARKIILARKTVLCWLIVTGFMTLKDVLQCRNLKNNEILKDGYVTWDGILCNCCIRTLSIPDFKAHADTSLPKSSLTLCLQSGKSFTLCQLEAWNAEYMDRKNNACIRIVEEVDENDDSCGFCGDGGELLCCDNCPSTYHPACLSAEELPDGCWYCHNCICQSCWCPVSEKVSSFSATLKCLQCGARYHDTCVDMDTMPFEDMDSDSWFCGRYCKEIFVGLHGRVGKENFLADGLSWTILRCNSGGQQLHSVQKIAHMVECNTKLAVALTLMEECFVRMVDTRTGIDMIPHVLYNQGSKYARLDYQGFYTVILEKGEEILCAASIRVHGTKAAELPFIATCAEYRRQGMCRRLISTIEEMLRTFHVKLLVLSAIPELVSTWVLGFGFKPIKENEKEQLDTINLMLFPDTSLLTKSLEGGIDTIKSGDGEDGYDVCGFRNNNCMPNGRGSDRVEKHDFRFVGVQLQEGGSTSQEFKR